MSGFTQVIHSQQDDAPVIATLGFKTYGYTNSPLNWHHRRRHSSSAKKRQRQSKLSAELAKEGSAEGRADTSKDATDGAAESAVAATDGEAASESTLESTLADESEQPMGDLREEEHQPKSAARLRFPPEIVKSGSAVTKKQASELTSFLSRIKYLHDECDSGDTIPLTGISSSATFAAAVASSSSSYTDQRALIRAQADRVRNQLDLKFSAIAFGAQLDEIPDYLDEVRPHYNPLRVIRDRANPEIARFVPRHPAKTSIWSVPVAELTQDMRWWYNHERALVHQQQRHQAAEQSERVLRIRTSSADSSGAKGRDRRGSEGKNAYKGSGASEGSETSEGGLSIAVRPSHKHLSVSQGSPCQSSSVPGSSGQASSSLSGSSMPGPSSVSGSISGPSSLPSSFVPSAPSEEPVFAYSDEDDRNLCSNLPQTQCAELIERLRNAHDNSAEMPELDEESSEGSLVKTATRNSAPQHESGDEPDAASSWAKSRFCRNSASVADTWNRLYRPRVNSHQLELRPPSLHSNASSRRSSYSANDQRRPSTQSEAISDELSFDDAGQPEVPPVPSAIPNSILGSVLPSAASSTSTLPPLTASKEATPLLVLTPENGGDVLLGLKNRRRSSAVPSSHRKPSAASVGSEEWMGEQFGSLNADKARRNPLEKKCCTLDAELRYLVAFYKTALHRPNAKEVLRPGTDLESLGMRLSVPRVNLALSDDAVSNFVQYLGKVEGSLVAEQQELDATVATPLDGLRVATDVMVSEVNITLNRQIRDVTARMERICAQRSGCAFYMSVAYYLLEYTVTVVMWAIWCFVTIFRFVLFPLKGWRVICNSLIVA